MVLARVADFFSGTSSSELVESARRPHDAQPDSSIQIKTVKDNTSQQMAESEEEARPRYSHAILAGGLGGLTGDMLMHSLDTVKTRQQGDPTRPPKYTNLFPSYYTILRQEGVARGLYGGVFPAFVGSFLGTSIFFGTYEWSKRAMIDSGYVPPSVAYFAGGWVADLAASPLYVPTEVLKTRLQLQGRYQNPHFFSGYNYRSSWDAARTIVRTEGWEALFHGYGATLWRDLPFSAMQFAFYEKEREFAKAWVGSKDIGLPLEIFVAMSAGGMAGTLSCPMDVVKTRIQTQINPEALARAASRANAGTGISIPRPSHTLCAASAMASMSQQKRTMFTNAPAPPLPTTAYVTLDTSSVVKGLQIIYRTEGLAGWFRGVGPRAVWTSIQTGTMLVLYQTLLRHFEEQGLFTSSDE